MLRGSARTYVRVYTHAMRMCVQIRKHEAAIYPRHTASDVAKPLLLTYFEQVRAGPMLYKVSYTALLCATGR